MKEPKPGDRVTWPDGTEGTVYSTWVGGWLYAEPHPQRLRLYVLLDEGRTTIQTAPALVRDGARVEGPGP